ncbi:MAG: ABC transporter ATP-binding protein [Prochlorococcus sp. MED-G73]|jgi:ABC-2 type transport system ATP-binding protein|uniref:ATPase n=2 Tax=Prochlorococcus marinus TaxID=1219 RepID=A0A0A2BYU7_PROMR|nr:ABC transporter ATP-binding protein [Prochlorococcus marinus]ABM75065.1 putative multidrug efflux ABC transporter [Prochlorococcus marinus str. NATL1A]KGG19266.1 ATPase [Prochlorococcus marinus str. PAC1]RCL51156.1 MAG: ABC transporter ATP-binding protein [Prochlorococcus sp. MED-G73]|tara:strand:- start:94 stop:1107 length:1014 start_codon:yes stop_codon:yes gene_type:complete
MFFIKLRDLFKSYGPVMALNGLNLEVPKGSLYGLLGPNGAGKSTALRIICTLLSPDSGHVEVGGHNVLFEEKETRRRLGYVAQDVAIDKILTGRELLQLQGDLYHLDKKYKRKRIEELIERLDMHEWIDRRCGSFSGGMKRRLDLSSGLLHEPELLILDEPTVGLDIESRSVIWGLLKELRNKETTILLSSHYLEEVDELADEMAIIDKGKVIASGKPDDLKKELGGDRVTLRVREFSDEVEAESVKKLIKNINGVSNVVVNQTQGYSLNFLVQSNDVISNLSGHLSKENFEVFALSHSRPSLDDVYLQATGKTLMDAELELAGKRDFKLENKKSMR